MARPIIYIPLVHLTLYSLYTLRLSYATIVRLQEYESVSEKAAEWSNTAAERLRKTRTTQGSAAITLATSLTTAVTLLLPFIPIRSRKSHLVLSGINLGILMVSRFYMSHFWNEKNQVKMPTVQKFNEAISQSERLIRMLGCLGMSWGIAGWVWWLHWRSGFGSLFYAGLVGVVTVLSGGF